MRVEGGIGEAFSIPHPHRGIPMRACLREFPLRDRGEKEKLPEARAHWDAAMRMWDGKGFTDSPFDAHQIYATYKLALGVISARRLSPPVERSPALLERLLSLQTDSGGWITDYDATGKPIGLANVETTCMAILAIEAAAR